MNSVCILRLTISVKGTWTSLYDDVNSTELNTNSIKLLTIIYLFNRWRKSIIDAGTLPAAINRNYIHYQGNIEPKQKLYDDAYYISNQKINYNDLIKLYKILPKHSFKLYRRVSLK